MHDLRLAARALARAPMPTLVVVGTLALGIGASTATFSVVNGVLLKPLPYAEPERLVAVWPEQNFNVAMVRELLHTAPALEAASGVAGWTFTLTGEGEPLEVEGARVSPRHFRILGVSPVLGRGFADTEGIPGSDGVVVLSHAFWVRVFGGDPAIVGRTIQLASNDLDTRTVIGVMPPGFRPVAGAPDVWVPLALDPSVGMAADDTWYVNHRVARLAAGATLAQASEQVRAFARAAREELPRLVDEEEVRAAGVVPLREYSTGRVGAVLWVALGAVSLVLLMACANVANLLLARGEARSRDLAVRSALGAGRGRVIRLLLLESSLLGLAGGAMGVALSFGLVRLVVALTPTDFPRAGEIGVDGSVLAYALAATLVATMLAGLAPALRGSRVDAASSLGGATRSPSARRSSRITPVLVGVELCLAVVVVVGSGLMLRSLLHMTAEDPGLYAEGVLVFRASPPAGRYPDGPAFQAYYEQVLDRVTALPGVERAGAIHLLPGTLGNWSFPTYPEGVDVPEGSTVPGVNIRFVYPGYFETVGTRLLQGRTLERSDDAGAERVVWVNQAFVDRFWPGLEPVGRTLRIMSPTGDPHRVVGVVGDVRQHGLGREPRAEMYFAHAQLAWNMAFWVVARVRSGRSPLEHVRAVQESVWSVDADVPITGTNELSRVFGDSVATTRFLAVVLGGFGLLALLLGMVGVFGVTTFTVGRRLPEFGVRIALGASPADVLRSALAGGMAPVALGLAAGLLAASATSGVLASALYDVEPSDPVTFALVGATLLAAATAASLWPAWRASRLDPVSVLGRE